jgi:hypothetical protein
MNCPTCGKRAIRVQGADEGDHREWFACMNHANCTQRAWSRGEPGPGRGRRAPLVEGLVSLGEEHRERLEHRFTPRSR